MVIKSSYLCLSNPWEQSFFFIDLSSLLSICNSIGVHKSCVCQLCSNTGCLQQNQNHFGHFFLCLFLHCFVHILHPNAGDFPDVHPRFSLLLFWCPISELNHCLDFPWILGSSPPFLLGSHVSFPTAYSMFHVEDLQAHQTTMPRACTNLISAFAQSSSSFCILYCSDWPLLAILSLCLTGIFKSFLSHANSVYISFFKICNDSQLLTS